jgi:hypothetical protein
VEIISKEVVEKTWKDMAATSLRDAPAIAKRFQKLQPFLSTYLLAVGGDELNRDERELLFYLGLVVWKIMAKGDKKLEEVSSEAIEEAEKKNLNMVNYLSEENKDFDFIKTVESIIKEYNQKNVLKYVVEALEEHDPEEGNLRDESIGPMFIYLKTVIDCLDQ